MFQYRKRYEVTCDHYSGVCDVAIVEGFNTASGMRSHATHVNDKSIVAPKKRFQYRKRYEVTCDQSLQ